MSEAPALTHRACPVENGRAVSAGLARDLLPAEGRKNAYLRL